MGVDGLAGHRDFLRLWLADAISLLGDWFTYVAVGALAVRGSDGLTAVALVLVAHSLPRALLSPLAGRIADRYDRRTIMVVFSVLRGLVVVAMAFAAMAEQVALVQGLLFVRMALGAFIDPAAHASLPQLVPASRLGHANALLGATWSVVFVVGVALGGVTTASIGVVGALVVDAITFGIAAVVFSTLPSLPPMLPSMADAQVAADTDRGRIRDAWSVLRHRPALLESVLAKIPIMLASGGAWILLHGVAGRFGDVAMALGLLHGVRGVGTGLGPLLWARIGALAGSRKGLMASTGLVFIAVVCFALASSNASILAVVAIWGVGTGAVWVTANTRTQTLAPGSILGRLSAIDTLSFSLAQCVTGLLGGVLADSTAVAAHSAWLGVVVGIAVWLGIMVVVRRRVREPLSS